MRGRQRLVLVLICGVLLAGVVASPPAWGAQPAPKQASHVVIIMLDQARPDTIQRYGMTNVQDLMAKGRSFPNALVGDMAAETVISHNVITSGLFPKHIGWSNEVYRDTGGVLGAAGGYYVTSSMTCAQYGALINAGGYKKLQDYLDSAFGEASAFASISQKRSSACTAGHTSAGAGDGTATDPEDIIFQIRGSNVSAACGSGWRSPEYVGVKRTYFGFTDNCSDRWWTFQGAGAYGTASISPANIYPLDGNRFVPGINPGIHVGGDNWSADAAIDFIENEADWHGMLVSLGGIDKLGHMWGPEDDGSEPAGTPGTPEEKAMRHLPFIAKNADDQVGRIVGALKQRGILDDTLIVITADHAAQTGNPFHGVLAPGVTSPACAPPSNGIRSDCNWYYGRDADEIYLDPSPAVAALKAALPGDGLEGSNLDFTYQDSHVALWLHDNSLAEKEKAAAAVLGMPGVIASYRTNAAQDGFVLSGTNPMSGRDRSWWVRHGQELLDTMAAPYGPDVVGLLATNHTYGTIGDHGGQQRLVQNIPMVFSGPGVSSKDSNRVIRLVDVLPTVLSAMGIDYDASDLDGQAVRLRPPGEH